MRRLAGLITLLSLLALPSMAAAADFAPAPGTYTADTDALTITGPGTNIAGTNVGGVATFTFGTVNVPSGVTINAVGSRPFKLVAAGSLTLAGVINGNGTGASNFTAAANAGGPGGFAGGNQNPAAGSGPGGGGAGSVADHGGGGGGFAGKGAAGGLKAATAGTAGTGGAAYGSADADLQGGSGGGGGASTGGGGGGGAIALFGRVVTITSTGEVHANGGAGAVGAGGASGGGSGGLVYIRGNVLDNEGQVTAKGGDGGAGGCCGDGGGGGGGRVVFRYTDLRAAGTPDVGGGTSGAAGGLGHGGLSPSATGDAGEFSQTTGTETINFDDATTAPCNFVSTTPLTEGYASRGVHFSGPPTGGGGAILNQCGGFGVSGHSRPNFLAFNTGVSYVDGKPAAGPETITFDQPISTVTINAGQGSGGTATLKAYRGTQLVGSAFRTSTAQLAPLTVSGEHITKLTLEFTGSAIVFDDLRWNTEPAASGDSFSVDQNGTLNASVTANDTDADGDPITTTLGSGPAHGTLALHPDGSFTYTPASGFSGSDQFSYTAGDGAASSPVTNVSIDVKALPATPTSTPTSTSTPTPTPRPAPATAAVLASTVSNGWKPFAAFTVVKSLSVSGLPKGYSVVVQCKTKNKSQQRKGCPYKSKTYTSAKAKSRLSLVKPFLKRKLPVGTRVTITITAPGFTGKRYTYTMRKLKKPTATLQCISPSGKVGKCT